MLPFAFLGVATHFRKKERKKACMRLLTEPLSRVVGVCVMTVRNNGLSGLLGCITYYVRECFSTPCLGIPWILPSRAQSFFGL
jgi:hypothetical protein